MHTICLIFILVTVCSRVFGQDLAASYFKDDPAVTLKLCQKAIDKRQHLAEAYFFKAMSYAKQASMEEVCGECLRNGISALQMLTYKDPDSAMYKQYPNLWSNFFQIAYSQINYYEQHQFDWQVKDLTKRLYDLNPGPYEEYLMGRWAFSQGDLYAATRHFNASAKEIYQRQLNDSMYLPVFENLSAALWQYRDLSSVQQIFLRVATLFDEDRVAPIIYSYYTDSIPEQFNLNDSLTDLCFEFTDSLTAKGYTMLSEEIRLQWFWNLWQNSSTTFSDQIHRNVHQRYPELTDHLLNFFYEVIATYADFEVRQGRVEEVRVADATKSAMILLEANTLNSPIEHIQQKLSFDLYQAVRLYAAFTLVGYTHPDWKVIGQQVANEVSNYLIEQGFDPLLYKTRNVFPTNEDKEIMVQQAAGKEVQKMIAQKHFSQAGEMLYQLLKENPTDHALLALQKEYVVADYMHSYLPNLHQDRDYGWTGDVSTCDAGDVAPIIYDQFIQVLNYVRRLAGVPDSCILHEPWNAACKETAIMMHAAYDLSHMPGPGWTCYTKQGATAAGMSNLSLGYGGVPALIGQLEDEGGGNQSVGHRRWILYPIRRVYGMGTTPEAMALWTLGGENANYSGDITRKYEDRPVAWPPAYYVPEEFMCRRWSFSLSDADFTDAVVEVWIGKKRMEVQILPLEKGYGQNTLVWEVGNLPFGQGVEVRYEVIVSQVHTSQGDQQYKYPVIFMPIYTP